MAVHTCFVQETEGSKDGHRKGGGILGCSQLKWEAICRMDERLGIEKCGKGKFEEAPPAGIR